VNGTQCAISISLPAIWSSAPRGKTVIVFCGGINSVLLGHVFGDKNDDDRRINSLSVKVRTADDMDARKPTDISMMTSDQTIPNEYPFAVLSKTPNASTAFIT